MVGKGMLIYLGVLIAIAFSAVALRALIESRRPGGLSYKRRSSLLTPAERSFYEVLVRLFDPQRFIVMCKVRVADVIEPEAADRKEWYAAWNRINQKHVDFLLVDRKRMAPVCAIELNDSSHGKRRRQRRDEWLRDAFQQARMPLVFVRAARAYDSDKIRQAIAKCVREAKEAQS